MANSSGLTTDQINEIAGVAPSPLSPIQIIDRVSHVNPDEIASQRDIARAVNLPREAVALDPAEFARQARVKSVDPSSFGPSLQDVLSTPEYAALVQDDLDNLSATETLLNDRSAARKAVDLLHSMILDMGVAVAGAGQMASEGGLNPLMPFIRTTDYLTGGRLPEFMKGRPGPISGFFERVAESGRSKSDELMPKFDSAIASGAVGGVKSALNMLTIAALTRNPSAILPVMTGQVTTQQYSIGRYKGMGVDKSTAYAIGHGGIEALTEMIPMGRLVGDIGKETLGKIIKNQWVEIPGEQLATAGQDFVDWMMLPENDDKLWSDYFEERPNAALQTFVATLVGTGIQTTGLYYGNKLINRGKHISDQAMADGQRLLTSRLEQARLDDLIVLAQESKVSGRAADVYKKFLEGAGSDQSIFIPVSAINDLIAKGEVVPPEMMPDPLGGDVEIPMDRFMPIAANPDNKKLINALRPHMKMGVDQLTAAEIEQGEGMTHRRLLEIANLEAAEKDALDKYWQKTVDELVATGRLSERDAKLSASIIPAMAAVFATRYGISNQESIDTFKTRIVGPGEPHSRAMVIAQAKEAGYEGSSPIEAAEWLDALERHGAEGMTVEARMSRARATGYDTETRWSTDGGFQFTKSEGDGVFLRTGKFASEEFAVQTGLAGSELRDHLVNLGYNGIQYENEAVAFLPSAVRSPHAAFDDATSSNTLTQETTNFKRWFGDSKVVDENGEPLRVFRGLRNEPDEEPQGIQWWTDRPDVASEYAYEDEGANVMPAYLSIKNPYYLETDEQYITLDRWMGYGREERLLDGYWSIMDEPEKVAAELTRRGYDGIIMDDGTPSTSHKSFVTFRPSQVKSAIGNNGNFDPTNPNILAQKVYHGTYAAQDVILKTGRAGVIYFSPSKEHAKRFGPNVIPATLDIKNLADLTDTTSEAYQLAIKTFNERGGWSENDDAMEGRTTSDFDPSLDVTWELFDNPETGVSLVLKDAGYDGVKLNEYDDQISYAVFSPDQVIREDFEQLIQTQTDPFKLFFENSAVVDGNGEPLVVWHHGSFDPYNDGVVQGGTHFGTRAAATDRSFQKERDRVVQSVSAYRGDDGWWYWETEDGVTGEDVGHPGFPADWVAIAAGKTFASERHDDEYTGDPDDYGVMTPVYLRINNPKYMMDQGNAWDEAIEKAREEGHDGIIYINRFEDPGSKSYIIFDSSQAKHATDNTGTFSTTDLNILRQEMSDEVYKVKIADWKRQISRLKMEGKEAWIEAPFILRHFGIANSIVIDKDLINLKTGKHQDLPPQIWGRLYDLLTDPVAVFLRPKWKGINSHKDQYNVVLRAQTKKGEYIIAGFAEGKLRTLTPFHHDPNDKSEERLWLEMSEGETYYVEDKAYWERFKAFRIARGLRLKSKRQVVTGRDRVGRVILQQKKIERIDEQSNKRREMLQKLQLCMRGKGG